MTAARVGAVVVLREDVGGERGDRLQQAESWLGVVSVGEHDEAAVDEIADGVEGIRGGVVGQNGLGRGQVERSGEHSQPTEAR